MCKYPEAGRAVGELSEDLDARVHSTGERERERENA